MPSLPADLLQHVSLFDYGLLCLITPRDRLPRTFDFLYYLLSTNKTSLFQSLYRDVPLSHHQVESLFEVAFMECNQETVRLILILFQHPSDSVVRALVRSVQAEDTASAILLAPYTVGADLYAVDDALSTCLNHSLRRTVCDILYTLSAMWKVSCASNGGASRV